MRPSDSACASESCRRLFAHLVCLLLPIYLWPRLVVLRRGTSCSCAGPSSFILAITLLLPHYLSNGIFIGFHRLTLCLSRTLALSLSRDQCEAKMWMRSWRRQETGDRRIVYWQCLRALDAHFLNQLQFQLDRAADRVGDGRPETEHWQWQRPTTVNS